ncbi:MAG TPA: zf-HC2 domain-containing protein [Blastocatellia bacterium]|nr:zf-HC2 domain-containing protein [Blastocatellia bacterium]
MKQETRNHKLIVQYLVGGLSEDEKTRLEQQYFGDDDFFEQLLVVEGELIDAYVRAELSGREREQFEAHILASPVRRQRVEIARALVECATQSSVGVLPATEKQEAVTWWQSLLDSLGAKNKAILLPLAAAVLVIVAGASLFLVETVRLRNQVERIQADRAELLRREEELQRQLAEQGTHNEQLASELQRERSQRELLEQELAKPPGSALSSITFILTPDLVRGAVEPKRLIIPRGAEIVRMQIDLDADDYTGYRAVLETVDGIRIWSNGSVKAQPHISRKVVTLRLPASLFTKGDYILTLSGVSAGGSLEDVGDYYFNVVKK